ncbi:MAG: ABC transporter ATP-binding protein [Rhizobiaceae bacterium]|nr:ABC transporter ATP-binding protein [Rhizobiaceae bacterium]
MLEISNARRVFFKGMPDEKVALDGLSLRLEKGDFAVVIGSNGAGKSTTMNAISGALLLDSGRIVINGDDVTGVPVHARARHVARVFQDPMKGTAASMTIAENMLLADLRQHPAKLRRGLTPQRREKYREHLSYLGLGLENRLDTQVSLLSGGQRQSLSLVMAVSGEPDILLLDEHTAALDPRTADLVLNATLRAVNALKLTTMMVTHNMQHAVDYGNRVIMLDAGKVLLELTGEEKARTTVPDLIGHFSVKTDRMVLGA